MHVRFVGQLILMTLQLHEPLLQGGNGNYVTSRIYDANQLRSFVLHCVVTDSWFEVVR